MINSQLEKKLGLQIEQVANSIEMFGNTSSASIPISLTQAHVSFDKYENICLVGFGVGLTINACLISQSDQMRLRHVDYANV
jgi:3-oxoacyl-[acyl-carrier-protein] synthase III